MHTRKNKTEYLECRVDCIRKPTIHREKFSRTVALAVREPFLFVLVWRLVQDWDTGYPKLGTKLAREQLTQAFRVTARLVQGNGSHKLAEPFN